MASYGMVRAVLELIRESCQASASADCTFEDQAQGLRVNFANGAVLVARPSPTFDSIKFIVTNFYAVERDQVADACAFVARANVALDLGHYAVELESHEIRYYYDLPISCITDVASARYVTSKTVHCVVASFDTLRRYLDMGLANAMAALIVADSLALVRVHDDGTFDEVVDVVVNGGFSNNVVVDVDRSRRRIQVKRGRTLTTNIGFDASAIVVVTSVGNEGPHTKPAHRRLLARLNARLRFGRIVKDRHRNRFVMLGKVHLGDATRRRRLTTLLHEHFTAAAELSGKAPPHPTSSILYVRAQSQH
ncbi:Uncharacterized protein PBTT_01453 [Plasmodiophora brassicae]|uniref:Uncharacterized protein n=1 Tax=Plasmodiophora brassicae TaxID=37360 RepID=A0A0G4II04_PLABS|nr:hypothetical protein PBRA_003674 [Plasmodiophora brassicae]SPQ94192.1 unnamed protein product [Plasmodiophora brassicae]